MKKVFLILLLSLSAFAPEKKLKVETTAQNWNLILDVIDQSEATPKARIAARNLIIQQLNDTAINK